jgi:putative PIN family toxin of toxin-antitoxin system
VKILFDSNVLISSVAYGGAAARAIDETTRARWKVFVSETILAETERIIRDKLGHTAAFARKASREFRQSFQIADEPLTRHQVPDDPDDTPILRAALSAGADYLVTRDRALLALSPVEGVRIITLAEYLHILQAHGFAME